MNERSQPCAAACPSRTKPDSGEAMTSIVPHVRDDVHGTRGRILVAALDLFSRHGYSAASMRQIAREVGVRESAIYVHFKSKQDILDTLFDLYGPGSTTSLFDALRRDALIRDPIVSFKKVLAKAIDVWCRPEERKFMRLGLMEGMRAEDPLCNQIQTAVESVKGRVKAVFEELMREGVIEKHDPDFILIEFMGPLFLMRHELTLFNYSEDSRERLKNFAARHIDFFFRKIMIDKENAP